MVLPGSGLRYRNGPLSGSTLSDLYRLDSLVHGNMSGSNILFLIHSKYEMKGLQGGEYTPLHVGLRIESIVSLETESWRLSLREEIKTKRNLRLMKTDL